MSKSDTVELLNETDELERQMSWLLFQAEMSVIWGGAEDEWRPGIPLYPYPLGHPFGQQTVRLMIQTLSLEAQHGLTRSDCLVWCISCEVGWEEMSPCWLCGEDGRAYSLADIYGVPPRSMTGLSRLYAYEVVTRAEARASEDEALTRLLTLRQDPVTPNQLRAYLGLPPVRDPGQYRERTTNG